uniref:Odorant binging protein n=1 Tax=Agrilus zanthoxylumi TaxID=2696312 RepID=A0A8A6HY33_9COLE|nr:odorant binging protein [Agrilus zanthoxylumi]
MIEKANKGDFADDDRLKCYLKCIMGQMAAMNEEGVIDPEAVVAVLPDELKDILSPGIRACGSKVGKDQCENAWLTHKCYYEHSPELKRNMLIYLLRKFCKYTKIPGYKFIVLPNRTRQERIFWIITLIITTIGGCIVSYAVVSDDPTKTEIVTDSTHHAVWNYLFPAVTICNINKISKRKAYDAAKKLKFSNKTVDELADDLRYLSQLIFYNDNSSTTQQKLNNLGILLKKNGVIAWKLLIDISPKCTEFITFCMWKGEIKACETLFQEIVTSDGVCCTFNYFAPRHPIYNRSKTIPERLSTCGRFTGLILNLKSDSEDYFATDIPSSGFTMKIHFTYNLIETNAEQPFTIRDKTGNFVHLSPSLIEVSSYVREMKISQRNCLLPNERELELSSQYSLRNCLNECKIKLIFKLCNCIPFYFYVKAVHKDKRICEISDMNCLINKRENNLRES